MIRDEAVQRILSVMPLVIIETRIGRIGLVIYLLGISYQVIQVIDPLGLKDGIGFNQYGKCAFPLTPEFNTVIGSAALAYNTCLHGIV